MRAQHEGEEPRERTSNARSSRSSPLTADVLDVVVVVVEHGSAGVALAATLTGVTPLTSAIPSPLRELAGGEPLPAGGNATTRISPLLGTSESPTCRARKPPHRRQCY